MNKKLFILLLVTGFTCGICRGQQAIDADELSGYHLKTNLLYDAMATLNLGFEFGLNEKTSIDVSGSLNPFTFSNNRKWKHFLIQPEYRIWATERYNGWFYGAHAHYAFYNAGNLPKPFSSHMRSHRFRGWALGAGVVGGYRYAFDRHWSMEAALGLGYAYFDYERFACAKCGESEGYGHKNYIGPTKVGLSLVYAF